MLGVFKTYIGKWEREEVLPSPLHQQRLGELFGKTAQELGFTLDASPRRLPFLDRSNPLTESFRRQLKYERELRGWSQNDLARALGVHYSNINRWERGQTFPSRDYWEKLAELFDKTFQELGLVRDTSEQEYPEHEFIIKSPFPRYGRRLSYLRRLKAWNQTRLAREVGTTPRSIMRWESGQAFPELRFQQRLCELFGEDPEKLGFIQEQVELTEASLLHLHNGRTPNVLLLRQRQVRGWTQRDVAEKIGTYPVNISKWESGETHPKQDFQQKLCELFRCKLEDLGLLQSSQAQI